MRNLISGIALTAVCLLPNVALAQLSDDEIDVSIAKAIRYLNRQQRPSGAWTSDQHGESTATTSLAIMAYMAAGHVPGEGPYGQRLNKGVQWVISQQKDNGLLVGRKPSHGPMYSHGISTLMLAEVVGMVDRDLANRTRVALEKAVRLILQSQEVRKHAQHRGGWRYKPNTTDSDLSVTGWQLLALRAAKDAGCDVPAENIDSAIEYVKRLSVKPLHLGFGYQSGHGPTPTRAGTGIVCLEVCGEHHCDEVLGAAKYFLARPLRVGEHYYFYGVYYCSVGMFKVGGDAWERARNMIFPNLLDAQGVDGSWRGTGSENSIGRNYATSMAVLALAIEYRFLPIYQR